MRLRSIGASAAGLMLVTVIGTGCPSGDKGTATRAETAATRAEDAAKRAESAASRVEAAAYEKRTCAAAPKPSPGTLATPAWRSRYMERSVALATGPSGPRRPKNALTSGKT